QQYTARTCQIPCIVKCLPMAMTLTCIKRNAVGRALLCFCVSVAFTELAAAGITDFASLSAATDPASKVCVCSFEFLVVGKLCGHGAFLHYRATASQPHRSTASSQVVEGPPEELQSRHHLLVLLHL